MVHAVQQGQRISQVQQISNSYMSRPPNPRILRSHRRQRGPESCLFWIQGEEQLMGVSGRNLAHWIKYQAELHQDIQHIPRDGWKIEKLHAMRNANQLKLGLAKFMTLLS